MTQPQELLILSAENCRCVRISPDGSGVLTAGSDGVRVRDTADGRLGWSRDLTFPSEAPVEAVWGAGGESVTLLGGFTLRLLDALTGADRPVPDDLTGRRDVTAVALSPDGLVLAVGTREGIILLWQQDTGRVTRLRGGGDPVSALAWRPSGDELCVARPRSIQFWMLAAETMISSIDASEVRPSRLAWAPDGDLIAVAGATDVRAISVTDRAESAAPLDTRARPRGLGISRSGVTVLVGLADGSVMLLDRGLRPSGPRSGRLAAGLVEPAGLHVNETGLVGLRRDAATVALHALADSVRPSPERVRSVSLRRWAAALTRTDRESTPPPAPVPTTMATRSRWAWTADGWCRLDQATGETTRIDRGERIRWTARAGPGPITVAERHVAVGTSDGRVTVLDARTGASLAVIPSAGPVSWSEQSLATAEPRRRDVLVYDLAWNSRRLPVPDGAGDPAWSPDGSLLAVGTAGSVVVWSAATFARVRRLDVGAGTRPATVVWSPDGRHLALDRPGGPVTVWDTERWQVERTLGRSAGGGRTPPAWSPDSRILAVAANRPIGSVALWDARRGRIVLTVPPPAGLRPVSKVEWAADGRFAVGYDDGTVVRWTVTLPPPDEAAPLPHPAPLLAALVAATATRGTIAPLGLLADLLSLILGRPAGPLDEFDRHPGVALLRSLRWPPEAAVGLAVVVAADLPPDEDLLPSADAGREEIREAVEAALDGTELEAARYPLPARDLHAALDRIDDAVLLLASLLGPDAVAASPDLLARVRSQSFGDWTLAPQQRRLLGLRSVLSTEGHSQGYGVGDTRAGVARHGELPSLLPSQLALPLPVLALKKSRDELLFRTRQGDLPVEAQPVVLLLDDTPAAFGAVGVTLRIVANLLAGAAIREQRRCALVPLSNARPIILAEMADLVHLWSAGRVERPDLAGALTAAATSAAQLSDTHSGLPRLVLLTHPYLVCPARPSLHVVRVHYPGIPVEDPAPRTHVLAAGAGADHIHQVVGAILGDRS